MMRGEGKINASPKKIVEGMYDVSKNDLKKIFDF